MKRFFAAALTAMIIMSATSCSREAGTEQETPVEPETVEPEKLGEYTFAGKTYDIHSAYYSVNESYYVLMFSPCRPEDDKTTYLMLAVMTSHDDVELDVTDYIKNYDYVLRYETPKWYYPETFAPSDGTVRVHRVSESRFSVDLNVTFRDGNALALSYEGDFTADTSVEE